VSTATTKRRAITRLLIAAVAIMAIALMANRYAGDLIGDPSTLAERVRDLPGASLWFVAAYAIAATLGLPATPFTLVGGVVFGVAKGSALNWTAATIGAVGSFLLARLLGADAVRSLLGRHAERLSWLTYETKVVTILRLRLIPVVPFVGLSIAAGLAGVPLRAFVIGTAVGIVPGTLIYTWFAHSLLLGSAEASRSAYLQLAIAATLLIALSFLPKLVSRFSSASAPATSDGVPTGDAESR